MEITKPIKRSYLRKILGKEFYIIKRKIAWWTKSNKWAKPTQESTYPHPVKAHRSIILRPLKDVEMYLQENKRTNLEIAIKKINGTVIKPGETFSIWKLVGRPTSFKGYKEGLVLEQGKAISGIGGGLCQLGNLLFWIISHSPLTITERYRHGYDVFPDVNRKVPFGSGATLSYNHIDFQFENNTSNDFHLHLWLDEAYLNGELTALHRVCSEFKIEERDHRIVHHYWGGYSRHNRLVKMEYLKDELINESLLVENDAIMMYEPLLGQGN